MGKLSKFLRSVRRRMAMSGGESRSIAPAVQPPPARPPAMTLERLRNALDEGQIEVHYQPISDIKSGLFVGAEALARLRDPEHGLLLPAEFIPLAEDTGFIIELGDYVLRTACVNLKSFQEAGFIDLTVSVNVSAKQFESVAFFETVNTALHRARLAAHYLQLEITETTAMRDPELSVSVMSRLHEAGVRLAIDDFGTGYSSLAALRHFPLDELKIDRLFIRNCTNNPDDAAIVMAVVSLARGMGLTAVAEGVETERQLEFLRSLQCNALQGFINARAMPAEDFLRLLRGGDNPFSSIAALP